MATRRFLLNKITMLATLTLIVSSTATASTKHYGSSCEDEPLPPITVGAQHCITIVASKTSQCSVWSELYAERDELAEDETAYAEMDVFIDGVSVAKTRRCQIGQAGVGCSVSAFFPAMQFSVGEYELCSLVGLNKDLSLGRGLRDEGTNGYDWDGRNNFHGSASIGAICTERDLTKVEDN